MSQEHYHTVRTVTSKQYDYEPLHVKPKFTKGDHVEIYYEQYQNHIFMIDELRYNFDNGYFEYAYVFAGMVLYYKEYQLRKVS